MDITATLELARTAARTSCHDKGFDACERLALSKTIPDDVVCEARQLTLAYVDILSGTRFMGLQPSSRPQFNPCNPGLLQTPEGYLVICRTVQFERSHRSLADDRNPVIRTENVVMRLSRDFSTVEERAMVIDEPALRRSPFEGLEDCRPYQIDGTTFVICATADRHPSGYIHLSICELGEDGRVRSHRPLVGPFDDRHQKNWLPLVDRVGTVRAVYGYDPLTLVRIDTHSGQYEVDAVIEQPVKADGWRGSAGPVFIPDSERLLMLVHQVVVAPGPERPQERVYLHRFVECDARFRLTRISRPFVFAHRGIEFACGLALTHDATRLVIGLGIDDHRAYLCEIDLACVERLLRHVRAQTAVRRRYRPSVSIVAPVPTRASNTRDPESCSRLAG